MSSGCGDVLSLADLQTAKKHQLFEAEVITGKQGGTAAGVDIDYATNQVTGQTQKTMPAILRDIGYSVASFDFASGGTLGVNDRNKVVLYPTNGAYYAWHGALPKVIPAASSPASTGGESATAWVNVSDLTLRTDLAATGGVNLVNNAQGFFDTVMSASAAQLKNGSLYTFKGRTATNDGGGGVFRYDPTSTATADNGVIFNVSGGGRLIRQVRTGLSENQIAEAINVRWFGAKGDAVSDDTAAVLAAYNFGVATGLFFTLLFPAGRYVTLTSFVFNDMTTCSFIMDGCTFIGGSNGADNSQYAVFEVRNVVGASISGPWSITQRPLSGPLVNNPNAYIGAFAVRAKPGGLLKPDTGICAFFSVNDLMTIRCGSGIRVGEVGNDAQTSEMQFVNCKTVTTVNPVAVGGSQTLVSFVGCTLASNPAAGISNAISTTIVADGGAVSITGGSVEQHSDSSTQMVLMGPASSATYGNPYGQVTLDGCAIESIAPLCNIANRFGYTSPSSYLSKFSISGNVGGYLGDVPNAVGVINVYDTSYAGAISVPDGCNFYAAPSSPSRAGYNINASGNTKARISVGKSAFQTSTGFKAYQAGVAGGIMLHPEVMATAASVTAQTIPASAATTIVWANNPTDDQRMGRYQYTLNTATGVLTIPDAGLKTVRIEASAVLDSASISGNIILYRNSTAYQYGVIGGGVATINASIPDPVPGEQITVRLLITAPSTLNSLARLKVFFAT